MAKGDYVRCGCAPGRTPFGRRRTELPSATAICPQNRLLAPVMCDNMKNRHGEGAGEDAVLDLVIEVRVSEEGKLVKEVSALEKMDSVSLISHDGETTY